MTRVRRLLALVLEVLLLQVSVLGGSMACGDVDANAQTGHAMAHAMAHATMDHASMSHETAPDAPAPTHQHGGPHCMAAGGCAAVTVTSPELLVATMTLVDATMDVADAHQVRATRPAPEPPPPRS